MSFRSFWLLPVIAVLAIAPVFATAVFADGPAISYKLGPTPNSYIISGTGFDPARPVEVMEMPCDTLPCGAEWLGDFVRTAVAPDGSFTAMFTATGDVHNHMDLEHRLILARQLPQLAGEPGLPYVLVPMLNPGTAPGVSAPNTGSGGAGSVEPPPFVALGLACVMLSVGALLLRRRLG